MKITLRLSADSCRKAIKELEKYQKDLDRKIDKLCKRLAEFGLIKAREYFNQALYDGIKDAVVTVEQIENGYAVRASGSTVLFLEFGAGVHYPNDHPQAGEFAMEHGTYGRGLGKNDYWFYTGQPGNAGGELAYGHTNSTITHGNPANMPMYKTGRDIKTEIKHAVEEVFRQ